MQPAGRCAEVAQLAVARRQAGAQLEHVPALRQSDRITLLEEEKVMGYYGAGTLFATPERREPLL